MASYPHQTSALRWLAVALLLCACQQARSQTVKTDYPKMAPTDQYLMEQTAEIALARTAAPPSISQDAELSVLGRQGCETK